MKCPNCSMVPMNFWCFLAIGWIHIKCGHCSKRLMLKSLGDRFWSVLAAGAVTIAAVFLFIDYSLRWFGESGTLALFVGTISLTLILAAFYAWPDSHFEVIETPHQ